MKKTRPPDIKPPLCLGHPRDNAPSRTGLVRMSRTCAVVSCDWAFECVNGAVTVEVEGDNIVMGESSGLDDIPVPHSSSSRHSCTRISCFGAFDSRPLMGCDGCNDFEACQLVTGAGPGVVTVVREHDSRYACFGNDENFCLEGDACPLHRDCCGMAGMVDGGVVVVLEEHDPNVLNCFGNWSSCQFHQGPWSTHEIKCGRAVRCWKQGFRPVGGVVIIEEEDDEL